MAANDLENMESFEFNLKLYKYYEAQQYKVKVTYADRPVDWKFNLNYANGKTQFDLLLHEELTFSSDKPLKMKKFNISLENQDLNKKFTFEEHNPIDYTYKGGVFRFAPLRGPSEDEICMEKYYDVHFSFLLEKPGVISARNSTMSTFQDNTYIIQWNINQDSLRDRCFILYSHYRLGWKLKLCSYWMYNQQMFRIILEAPLDTSFYRVDPILKSNLQFLSGNQCLLTTTNDSYSWDNNKCSFVTSYETSKLLSSDIDDLKVRLEFTVDYSESQNIELPSRSSEFANCNIAAINKKKMDAEVADLRLKSTVVSEYNYVLKWDTFALPTKSSPFQVTYCQSHIIWNMKLISCSKIDKNLVKFALHTPNNIQFHQKDPILDSSLIIMRNGNLLVSQKNDLYTWNDGTFEFKTSFDTSEWHKIGEYKIRFEFTLEKSKQQNLESTFPSAPASSKSSSSDSFEIITPEQCSDDGSISSIEVIPIDTETAPLASFAQELTLNSSSSNSHQLSLSNDAINVAVSDITDEVPSVDQCSDADSISSIEEISADLEPETIPTTSQDLSLPETKDDCLCVINDEKPAAVRKYMRLTDDFQRLFDTSSNYDTVINLVFKVHRSILAIRSPEFDRMIKDEQTNKAEPLKLTITDVSLEDMRALLKYIYTGTFDTGTYPDRSCRSMIVVAERFGVTGLKMFCEDILCSEICATNFLDNMQLLNDCKSEKVHQCLLTYMKKNINDLMNSIIFKQFMMSKPEIMFKLLSRLLIEPNMQ